MYRKIYQILEETGKVKTAMVLNGNHKGEKCLIKENHCLSSDENTADFWKKYEADLAECQETKVVHMGDVDFFVESTGTLCSVAICLKSASGCNSRQKTTAGMS